MRKIDWDKVKYFSSSEFKAPDMLVPALIYTTDKLRKFINKRISIHCDYEKRETGFHPLYMALDLHAENMHWFDLYLAASRFDLFNGIGCYPNWNNPGIHVDIRPKISDYSYDSRWLSPAPKVYIPLTTENLKKYL